MNNHAAFADLKAAARENLAGHYGQVIAAFITVEAITLFASLFISSFIPLTSIMGLIISELVHFIVTVLSGLLQAGLVFFFLKLCCGQPIELMDIFYPFKNHRNQVLTISLFLSIISYLCSLPGTILSYRLPYPPDAMQSALYMGVTLLGAVVSMMLTLPLSQSYLLLFDFPEYTAGHALLKSTHIMRGNCIRLFLLQISFYPLFLLSAFSCGLGLLWVIPYLRATTTEFYLDLVKK